MFMTCKHKWIKGSSCVLKQWVFFDKFEWFYSIESRNVLKMNDYKILFATLFFSLLSVTMDIEKFNFSIFEWCKWIVKIITSSKNSKTTYEFQLEKLIRKIKHLLW